MSDIKQVNIFAQKPAHDMLQSPNKTATPISKKGTNPVTDLQDPTPMKFKDQINLDSGDATFIG